MTPHSKNPRQINKQQTQHLEELIKKFGLIDKPILNKDLTIIGGHQRIKILKKMKSKEVECWIPNRQLTDEEIDHLCIGLNLNQGQWDYDILANEWDPIDLLKWGFTEEQLLGIEEEEKTASEALEDDEEEGVLEPCKDEDAITKLGDVYELGNHRVVCGDSTELCDTMACIRQEKPILMVTDPQYGVNYDASWRKDIKGKLGVAKAMGKVHNDDQVNWERAFSLFPGVVAYVWHAGKYSGEVEKSLIDLDYEIISQIIWVKQHFSLSRGDYHWQHEPCWYAVKKGCTHNWQGARDQATVWNISNLNCFGKSKDDDEERTAHSTQKPIECMARAIKNNTSELEGVYDRFLGSGTTLIACEKLKRICYGIEISPAYCDIIIRRYINLLHKRGSPIKIIKNGQEVDSLPYITA